MDTVNQRQFSDLMEGDEVERFFQQFILPKEKRDQLPPAATAHLPTTTGDVLRDTKAIWEQKGLLSPAELRAELLQHYLQDSNPTVKDLIAHIELSRNVPEQVTGYLSKEHAYTATGLAHLYAKETGHPVAMAEVDFSNMGGTNKEFERRIAAENNIPLHQVNARDAELITDQAVKVLSSGMTTDLASKLPEGSKIIPIRTGGDEVRLIFSGVDNPATLQHIQDALHAGIEQHVAAMGLQDHPHLKDPTNPARNGFGAAVAIQDMRSIHDPNTLIHKLDTQIKVTKNELGLQRLGQIDHEMIKTELEGQIASGKLQVPPGLSPTDFVQEQLTAKAELAQQASQVLRELNPLHNPQLKGGLDELQRYTDRTLDAMPPSPITYHPLPPALDGEIHMGENRPKTVAPMASLDRRRYAIIQNSLEQHDTQPKQLERFFLRQSVAGLSPTDPSAQVHMPKDMPGLADVYAAEIEEYRQQFDPHDPAVQRALADAGLHSLDDLKAHGMAVSFHGLASLNDALGHHNADITLRHMGHDIIGGSFAEAGLPTDARHPYTIAHHNGGNFSVLVQPGAMDADGKPVFMSPNRMERVTEEISRRIDALNATPVDSFLHQKGVVVDEHLQQHLQKIGLTTFADLQDSKLREVIHQESKLEGRINGIMAVSITTPIEPNMIGSSYIGAIRDEADARMETARNTRIVAESQQAPSEQAAPTEPTQSQPAQPQPAPPPPVETPENAKTPEPPPPPPPQTEHMQADLSAPALSALNTPVTSSTLREVLGLTPKSGVTTAGLALIAGSVVTAHSLYNGQDLKTSFEDGTKVPLAMINPLNKTLEVAQQPNAEKLTVATEAARDVAKTSSGIVGTVAGAQAFGSLGLALGGPPGAVVGATTGAVLGAVAGTEAVDHVVDNGSALYQKSVDFTSEYVFEGGAQLASTTWKNVTTTFNALAVDQNQVGTVDLNPLHKTTSLEVAAIQPPLPKPTQKPTP